MEIDGVCVGGEKGYRELLLYVLWGCWGGWWRRKDKVRWWIKEVCAGEGGNGGGGVEGFGAGNNGGWYCTTVDY